MRLSDPVFIMNKKLIWSFQKKIRKEMLNLLWVNFVSPPKDINNEKDWTDFCKNFITEFEKMENNPDQSSCINLLCYMNVHNQKLFGHGQVAFRVQENRNALLNVLDADYKTWPLKRCYVQNGKYVNCEKNQIKQLFDMSLRKEYCLIPIVDLLDLRVALLNKIKQIRDSNNYPYKIPVIQ